MIPTLEIQVRYGDLDVMGHVNNCIYLSYFEMARVHYLGQLLGRAWDWNEFGVLVVRNEVEYLEPILLTDKPLIYMWCTKVGSKSFELEYSIVVGEKECTKGKTIMVCFDGKSQKSIEIPALMLEGLEKLKK